jgi:ERCC4-type nuclease
MKSPPPPFVILCDTREQSPPPFPDGVVLERRTMPTADYTTEALLMIAVVERKSPADLAGTLSFGRERWDREVERMHAFRWKALVVEGSMSDVMHNRKLHPNSLIGSVASLAARHDVQVLFVPTPECAGRMIAGLLRRWQERLQAEEPPEIPTDPNASKVIEMLTQLGRRDPFSAEYRPGVR